MPQPRPSTALAGLKVLDLTRVRAGPTCVRVFADFGADVIKVESPPGLDPNENMSGPRLGYDMQNLHRNKRSLALNLKTPEGKAILMKLVDEADLVVENFRPDVKERLGLDFETLHARNPRLILVSISGFGQSGPYRTRAGFDQRCHGRRIGVVDHQIETGRHQPLRHRTAHVPNPDEADRSAHSRSSRISTIIL